MLRRVRACRNLREKLFFYQLTRCETGFHPGCLCVIVDVVDDDSPLAVDVSGSLRHGVFHIGGAQITLGSHPVRGVIGASTLKCVSISEFF